MVIGVPRELKPDERRVAVTPAGARELTGDGHRVLVERGAGLGSRLDDEAYERSGAELADRDRVWAESDMVVKVKEPVEDEYPLLRPDLIVFTYLHLAASPELTEALLDSGACGIAYETVTDQDGALPLLAPMSEIAGRLAAHAGASLLQATSGGKGVLIGGAPGVAPARVLVLGGGVAGVQAARIAAGMGAEVTILELSLPRVRELEWRLEGEARVLVSDGATIEEEVRNADVVIGTVLVPGAKAPKLVDRSMLRGMDDAGVLVDIAIDQGGCAETSRPTTHAEPTFLEEGVLHYCVTNMPGAVPSTATRALTNATLPYVRALATDGLGGPGDDFYGGLNVRSGELVNEAVARAYA